MDVKKTIRSAVAVVLFSLLIISFAFFGVHDVFKPVASDTVLKVGSREISSAEFKNEFNRRRDEMQEKAQRPISVDEAVAQGLDTKLIQFMLGNEAIDAAITKLGLHASPEMVAAQLRESPAFFDQVTGRFDPKAYATVLGENGLTPKIFEKKVAEDITRLHFISAMTSGLRPPLTYGAMQGVYALEQRDTRFIYLDPGKVAAPPAPTDAQLQAFLDENADKIRAPELRQLTVVRFSTAALLPTMTADPAQVQKVFDFRKDQAAKPETRTLVQVPAKTQAAAQAIAARLAKGEDPAAVAKANDVSVISYANKPKSALPDRKVAEAAFALAAGQTSGPIQGDLGFAVVKVLSITPGQTVELEAVRKQVEDEVRHRAAELKITEAADKFEEAHSGGADIVAAAKTAGGQVFTTPPVTAQGVIRGGQMAPGLSPKLLQTAFGLGQGEESEFQTDQPGEYFIVRVDKVTPPAVPPLAEIKADLTRAYLAQARDKALKAKAEELAARLRKGETLEAVAASVGTKPNKAEGVNRINAQKQAQVLGGPLISGVLDGKKGDVIVVPAPQPGVLIAKIENIRAAPPEQVARFVGQSRDQIGQQLTEELGEAMIRAATKTVKTKTFPDRARSAIGAEPLADATVKSKDKAG